MKKDLFEDKGGLVSPVITSSVNLSADSIIWANTVSYSYDSSVSFGYLVALGSFLKIFFSSSHLIGSFPTPSPYKTIAVAVKSLQSPHGPLGTYNKYQARIVTASRKGALDWELNISVYAARK